MTLTIERAERIRDLINRVSSEVLLGDGAADTDDTENAVRQLMDVARDLVEQRARVIHRENSEATSS